MRKTTPAPAPTNDRPTPPVAETAVSAAVRRIMAKMDKQHAEIARLLREVQAALT
jgi:hypothetical protein